MKVKEVGRDLGVSYVLEGSVRKAMNMVRITAQLIDATIEGHLRAERYDRDLVDIFALQDDVTLTEDEQLLLVCRYKYTCNMEFYDHYLRNLEYFYRFTEETNKQARAMFEKSLVSDPTYALARAYYMAGQHDMSIEALERSIELPPNQLPSYVFSAAFHSELGREEEARAPTAKNVKAQPTFSINHWEKCVPYMNQADADRWIEALRRAGMK